jgi:hypothetical protein
MSIAASQKKISDKKMDPVKVFLRWFYTSMLYDVKTFLELCKCLNKDLYGYTNRVIPEIAQFRAHNVAKKGDLTEIFCNTPLGQHCSLYLASNLLNLKLGKRIKVTTASCLRNFRENPNLATVNIEASHWVTVQYCIKYKKVNFKDDALFKSAYAGLTTNEKSSVWGYISGKRGLAYCLNNFPRHTKDIVDAAMQSEHFEVDFLQIIDKYKDNLYSPLQRKQALARVSFKRSIEDTEFDSVDDVKEVVDKINDTTAFLLKRRRLINNF